MLSGKQYNFSSEAFSDVSVFSFILVSEKYSLDCVRRFYGFLSCCNGQVRRKS